MLVKRKVTNGVLIGVFVLIGLLGITSLTLAQGNTWITKADMPTARAGLSTCAVDGKIYAIGGAIGWGAPGLKTVEEYDPETDTWATKAEMLTGRTNLSTSVVNGKIYAIGGGTAWGGIVISTVEEYDPETNTWTPKADMPTPRAGLSTSVINGKIYAIGGATDYATLPLSTVEEYDPATNTWTTKADMPTTRAFLSASAVNGKIYAIGGAVTATVPALAVEEYDPVTNIWATVDIMPEGRGAHCACAVNGKIYVIGGIQGFVPPLSMVEEYDPATGIWESKADMPTARSFLAASVVDGKIYAMGGAITPVPNFTPTDAVEEYTPEPIVSIPLDIKPQSCPNPLNTKSQGRLPVAILGTDEFDVTNIDPSTVLLEGISPIHSNIEDVSKPVVDGEECECTTDGGDGYVDLTLKFDTQAIVTALGDVTDGEVIPLTLTGELLDGTPIEGKDCVVIRQRLNKSIAESEGAVPENYALFQNYPNPFNPSTTIEFSLPQTSFVTVKVYNSLGEEVSTLVSGKLSAGHYKYDWEASSLTSGLYFYRIDAGGYSAVKKALLLK